VFFFIKEENPDWYDEALQRKGRGFLRVIESFGARKEPTLAYIRAVNDINKGDAIGVLVATNVNLKIQESFKNVSLPVGDIFFMDMANTLYAGTDYAMGSTIKFPTMNITEFSNRAVYSIQSENIYVMNTNIIQQHKLAYQIPIHSLVQ